MYSVAKYSSPGEYGRVPMLGPYTFYFYINHQDRKPEVYGWVEDERGEIVPGTSGWYRTQNPDNARAAAEFNLELV